MILRAARSRYTPCTTKAALGASVIDAIERERTHTVRGISARILDLRGGPPETRLSCAKRVNLPRQDENAWTQYAPESAQR